MSNKIFLNVEIKLSQHHLLEDILFPLSGLHTLVKSQLTVGVWFHVLLCFLVSHFYSTDQYVHPYVSTILS